MNRFARSRATRGGHSKEPTDAALVIAARSGDKAAFVQIVTRHQALVCGVAFGLLSDFAASEDAAQEAFLTAWKRLGDLREPDKLRSWLSQIARNAALGALRRRRDVEALDESPEFECDSPLPDQIAATEDEAALVRSALARLPENYRLPLVLFYCESQSVSAVASALDLSEDAVKQRLSRGREMLRERMSGLVEDVLARSRPNAVFTMTVAAAIGALAAPSVVAGAVFAGASSTVAASTVTASATETIIAAMSTSKVMWGTAAAVALLCIPVGYNYAPRSAPIVDPAAAGDTGLHLSVSPSLESALFAEWRALHEKHGTNAAAMPLIFEAISELKDPARRRAFEMALAAEWAEVDPAGGFARFSSEKAHGELRRLLFENWLAADPSAAIDNLLASDDWHSLARGVLGDIARRAPERLVEIVSQLPKPRSFWDTTVLDAFVILARSQLPNARLHAETVTGPNRDQALGGIAKVWAATDLEAALEWADEMPKDVDRAEIKRLALVGRAAVDPVEALDSLDLVPPGGRDLYFASTSAARVLRAAAVSDFDGAVRWLADHPGRLGHDDVVGLAEEVTRRLNADPVGFLNSYGDPETLAAIAPAINSALLNDSGHQRRAVWDWLESRGDDFGTHQIRSTVLSSAAYQAPDVALEFAADLPTNEKGSEARRDLARNLLNHGQMIHRFDQLYDEAPASLKPALLEAAFESLTAGRADDLTKWINRLSLLPDQTRSQGVMHVATALAERSPQQALDWVTSLPAGDRGQAYSGIVSHWVYKDFDSAAEWVGGLPPGSDREQAVHSLVSAASQDNPHRAWNWALTIVDPALRKGAALELIHRIQSSNPEQARQWIESGPFDEATRRQLLAPASVFQQARGGMNEE